MATNRYSFVTHWRLPGTCEQVYGLLNDLPTLKTYWPSLYREVSVGDDAQTVKVRTKGFLPYVIDWMFRVTERQPYRGFKIEAWGDLAGRGEWSFVQKENGVDVTYSWTVSLQKPYLRHLFFLRPILSLNHSYVMRQGRRGLAKALKEGA